MNRLNWLGTALISFMVFSATDTVAYSIYSFEQGYYFFAPIDHIVAFHSGGLGLITLVGMVVSAMAMLLITYFM